MNQDIISLLTAALECSVFLNPVEPGLTGEELFEVGRRTGYQDGEIGDAMRQATTSYFGSKYFMANPSECQVWSAYFPEEPELRNFKAFDFVVSQLNDRVKADGAGRAQLPRDVLVERALAIGITRKDIEAAITYQILAETLVEKDGVVRFPGNAGVRGLPSALCQMHGRPGHRPAKAQAYPVVKDLIERRTDGRAQHAEPLDAFVEQLDGLKFGRFRLWWTQTVSELRQCDPQRSPLSCGVLAAALVEGALTFVVKHARDLDLDVFRSKDFDGSPRSWKIDDLIKSAATGGPSAVLDLQTKARAETLCRTRQRIHAGRMLTEYPSGLPDLRPEEARDARGIAEQVVRGVLDWLHKYPPTA